MPQFAITLTEEQYQIFREWGESHGLTFDADIARRALRKIIPGFPKDAPKRGGNRLMRPKVGAEIETPAGRGLVVKITRRGAVVQFANGTEKEFLFREIIKN
jgi:hypothetical protein